MDLRELVVAYGEAQAQVITEGAMGTIAVMRAQEVKAARLLAELDRRIALAGDDHPIMWRSHLDETEASVRRQRAVLRMANKDRLEGWRLVSAAAHVRADLIEEHRETGEARHGT
jgi:hypothetical protein